MIACKVKDEYGDVKDLVQERDSKRLALAPVTAPYNDTTAFIAASEGLI